MSSYKYHRTSPEIRRRAKELRKSATPAEQKLWQALRNRNLEGYKFRRQHPLGPFIADFFCAEVGLVIEVDGWGHLEQREYDQARTDWLEDQGYHVIRYWNDDVLMNLDEVTRDIVHYCKKWKAKLNDDQARS
ncbi:MAG: endonuclease domain-containing protein [Anaerolineaceae bacterium]